MLSSSTNIQVISEASILVAATSILVLVLISRIVGRSQKKLERQLSEKYRHIYRVKSLPSESSCILQADGASIKIGDYGWEAEPIRNDHLTYLHGLNDKWQVVWYAGFRPEEIEIIGPKPRSQYYAFPYWMNENIPPCPYPVGEFRSGKYLTTHFGFPQRIHRNWVQGKRLST
jgi:hypothetical protein